MIVILIIWFEKIWLGSNLYRFEPSMIQDKNPREKILQSKKLNEAQTKFIERWKNFTHEMKWIILIILKIEVSISRFLFKNNIFFNYQFGSENLLWINNFVGLNQEIHSRTELQLPFHFILIYFVISHQTPSKLQAFLLLRPKIIRWNIPQKLG